MLFNINSVKKCAFCKYWNDPANSAIMPKTPSVGLWKITSPATKCICLKKNLSTLATAFCSYYDCKIPK